MEKEGEATLSLTDLPAPCIVRICRWVCDRTGSRAAEAPNAGSGGAGGRCAVYGLSVSCRKLRGVVKASWPAIFEALLFETRLGPHGRPLPPHIEAGFHHNLPPRHATPPLPQEDGTEATKDEAAEEAQRQLKDRKHRERVIARTYLAAMAYESMAAEMAGQPDRFRVPSDLRQALRRTFSHRASYLEPEVYAARLPGVPRMIFKQRLVPAWTVIAMALRGASFPVLSLQMELPANARKLDHVFGYAWIRRLRRCSTERGLPEARTYFSHLKDTAGVESALRNEHAGLSCWSRTLHGILYGGKEEDSSDDDDLMEGAEEDKDWAKALMKKLHMMGPPVGALDTESVMEALTALLPEDRMDEDEPFRLYSDVNEGPHGHPDGSGLTEEARRLKKLRMLPYDEDPTKDPHHTCNLVPMEGDLSMRRPTRDDFLFEHNIIYMGPSGGALIGWRVREKQDITMHSESDSSLGSDWDEENSDSDSDADPAHPTD